MMKKKENNKQTLFENMMKINPDLKNNVRISNMLNENVKLNENITLSEYDDDNEFDRAHQGERDIDVQLGFFMGDDPEFQSTTERTGSNSFTGTITHGEEQYIWEFRPAIKREVKLWTSDGQWGKKNLIGSFPLGMWEYTEEDDILAIGEEIKNVIMNNGGLQEVEDYNTNSVDGAMGFAQSHAERETPDGAYDDDVEIEPEDEEGDRKWAEKHNKMMRSAGVETWKRDIDPSNHEQFIKQAKGLGMRAQELYDEMKAEEDAVNPQSINEGELSREDMMAALKSKFGLSHVDTTENFYQDSGEGEGGIWVSGENGDLASDGTELFDYYSTDYKNREFGIHNEFNKFCEDNGWYPEWNDPGTLMVWSNSLTEKKGIGEGYDDDDEDDPDAGHTVNGEALSPDEYRRWREEEGEPDDRDAYQRKYGRRPSW